MFKNLTPRKAEYLNFYKIFENFLRKFNGRLGNKPKKMIFQLKNLRFITGRSILDTHNVISKFKFHSRPGSTDQNQSV